MDPASPSHEPASSATGSAPAPAPAKPTKPACAFHPAVESIRGCERCRKPVCAVCEFSFPGNIRLCPECVSAPPPGVSGGRIALAVVGIALAILSMALWGALVSGALGQHSQETVGQMFVWLIMLPGLAAFAISVSALDRRLGNNPLLWIAASLGTLIAAVLLTLVVIGNLNK